jgi:5,6,7,8-tetrahydromethanopterin hydro-lyase
MLHIGEGFEGEAAHSAHVTLLLGPNDLLAAPFAVAAASPALGHVPFQLVLKPNVAVRPPTLFVAKAALRDEHHERMTWGPAQMGVATAITESLLDATFPPEVEHDWLAIALVWVDWRAEDADLLYRNNRAATRAAARRAMTRGTPSRSELAAALGSVGNRLYAPPRP